MPMLLSDSIEAHFDIARGTIRNHKSMIGRFILKYEMRTEVSFCFNIQVECHKKAVF